MNGFSGPKSFRDLPETRLDFQPFCERLEIEPNEKQDPGVLIAGHATRHMKSK